METESKLNSDVSDQTNHLPVIHTENVTLSEPAVKKIKKSEAKELEEDVEDKDRDRKKKRKVLIPCHVEVCHLHHIISLF